MLPIEGSAPPSPRHEKAVLVGAVGSFVGMSAIASAFIFLYMSRPILTVGIMLLCILVSFLPSLHTHGLPFTASLLACVFIAMAVGVRGYYVHTQAIDWLLHGEDYTNVDPAVASAGYLDASSLEFADGTYVDDNKTMRWSVLEGGVSSYCVAPIVKDQDDRVSFWAAGIDCCGKFQDFMCDRVTEPTVKGGIVLRAMDSQHGGKLYDFLGHLTLDPIERREHFLEAIDLASKVHGLTLGGSPMLVLWNGQAAEECVAGMTTRLYWEMGLYFVLFVCVSLMVGLVAYRHADLLQAARRHESEEAGLFGLPPETPLSVIHILKQRATGTSITLWDVLIFGICMPLVVILLCTAVWSWTPCFEWGVGYAFCSVGSLVALVGALLGKPDKSAYSVLILLAAVVGSYVGRRNAVDNAFHYCTVDNHRAYTGVNAEEAGKLYADAGSLTFEEGTGVVTDYSLGLLHQGDTYCVAPVVHCEASAAAGEALALPQLRTRKPPQCAFPSSPQAVEFWAVGMDCCDERGGFDCGRSSHAGANAGLVLRRAPSGDMQYRILQQALRSAVELYALPEPEDPVLLVWTDDLKAARDDWFDKAMVHILWTGVATFSTLAVAISAYVLAEYWNRWAEREKQLQG